MLDIDRLLTTPCCCMTRFTSSAPACSRPERVSAESRMFSSMSNSVECRPARRDEAQSYVGRRAYRLRGMRDDDDDVEVGSEGERRSWSDAGRR